MSDPAVVRKVFQHCFQTKFRDRDTNDGVSREGPVPHELGHRAAKPIGLHEARGVRLQAEHADGTEAPPETEGEVPLGTALCSS